MRPESSLATLREMLAASGVEEAGLDVSRLWPAVRAWVAIPVEGLDLEADEDMLLFEGGISLRPATQYTDGPAFWMHFTRQFMFRDEEGEYGGMEHLTIELRYAIEDAFRAITRMKPDGQFGMADGFWGVGGPTSRDWSDRVEATKSFQTASRHEAMTIALSHGPV